MTGFAGDNKAAIVNSGTAVASMGTERIVATTASKGAGSIAGALVQPAVWILDYGATGSKPDETDLGLYALGFFGPFAAVAAAGTSIIKGLVDDETRRRLDQAKVSEPQQYREFMLACVDYSYTGQGINAMTIASKGGTAWEHPNGLWVYLTDATGKLVCDYDPKVAKQVYQPLLPLRSVGDGFRWHSLRGGA